MQQQTSYYCRTISKYTGIVTVEDRLDEVFAGFIVNLGLRRYI